MNQIKMPALTGDSPLAILAAIGVLKLCTDFIHPDVRLSWDAADRQPVIHSKSMTSLKSITDALADIVQSIPQGVTVPGAPAGFPPPGAAPDKLRVPQGGLPEVLSQLLAGTSAEEASTVRAWLGSLVTDLAVDGKRRGAISQFAAPAGQQSMATMLDKPIQQMRREPDYVRQALVSWRRVSGVTGEYLDHRALWDAVDDPAGASEMRGVPGATWLALMSYPLWLTTASGKQSRTSGWHSVTTGRRHVQELRLPLWVEPLGPAAVKALIEHPVLDGDLRATDTVRSLRVLGVIHICRARRRPLPGGKSAGILATMT